VAARAKGLSEARIIWRHALRNAMVPLVTVVALSFAGLLEGSVLTETVFAWPGLGLYITNSLQNADMNAVLGGTLVVGAVFISLNLLSDLLYRVLDPRTRDTRGAPGRVAVAWHDDAARLAAVRAAQSRRQAALGRAYAGWCAFASNRLALVGLASWWRWWRWRCWPVCWRRIPPPWVTCTTRGCCPLRPPTGWAPTTRAATSSAA
jgi:hypothetical protein